MVVEILDEEAIFKVAVEIPAEDGVDVATQSGRTIDLFDWTGVTPTGAFTISSPYTWNLTNLYTTGEVRMVPRRYATLVHRH